MACGMFLRDTLRGSLCLRCRALRFNDEPTLPPVLVVGCRASLGFVVVGPCRRACGLTHLVRSLWNDLLTLSDAWNVREAPEGSLRNVLAPLGHRCLTDPVLVVARKRPRPSELLLGWPAEGFLSHAGAGSCCLRCRALRLNDESALSPGLVGNECDVVAAHCGRALHN